MPHARLEYSAGLSVDAPAILAAVEAVLQARDPGSGDCKGRAYPAEDAHHNSVFVEVSMLPKAHRDSVWCDGLRDELVAALTPLVPRPSWLSIDLRFSGPHYHTEMLT
ncbi:MAG: hypothetical protein AAGM84_06240 [Pseudomonadota bacterium]